MLLEADDPSAKVRYGTLLTNYLKARPRSERRNLFGDVQALLDETPP
jgi:hypothetical protein